MKYLYTSKRSIKGRVVDGFIYIFLAAISVIWLFPFMYLILTALRGESTQLVSYIFPKEWSLKNFVWLFTSEDSAFLDWYKNTLFIAAVVAVLNTMITLLTAYALSRMRFNGRVGLMKFMLILGMFPGFLGMICIYHILNAMGLIGNDLSVFGLILVYISGTVMGYQVSKGFFDTIPKSLDEAAMIDGATKNRIFWSIILPLSKPIIIQTALNAFVGPWGDYMMANYIVGRGADEYKTVAIGLYSMIDSNSKIVDHFTHFCAGGVVVSIVPIILFFYLQKYYVEGVTGGSVKG